MQHFDLSPLYRASIGFDQVSDLMNRVISTNSTTTSYPPGVNQVIAFKG